MNPIAARDAASYKRTRSIAIVSAVAWPTLRPVGLSSSALLHISVSHTFSHGGSLPVGSTLRRSPLKLAIGLPWFSPLHWFGPLSAATRPGTHDRVSTQVCMQMSPLVPDDSSRAVGGQPSQRPARHIPAWDIPSDNGLCRGGASAAPCSDTGGCSPARDTVQHTRRHRCGDPCGNHCGGGWASAGGDHWASVV